MSNFNLYSRYYDLLYDDKDTEAECDYLFAILGRHGQGGKHWLEFGAGSGRHGQVLSQRGIAWTGIELSQEMANIGKAKGLEVHIGDIRNASIAGRHFDVVLAIFHVISYLPGNTDVLKTFQNAYRHLKPDGVFLFDVWYSPAVYQQKPEHRLKKVENQGLYVEREAIPSVHWNENTINVHYNIRVQDKQTGTTEQFSEDHLMRHFSLPELKLFAGQAGFELIHTEEWLTGQTPGPDTWGICCILKKK